MYIKITRNWQAQDAIVCPKIIKQNILKIFNKNKHTVPIRLSQTPE